MDRTGLYNSFTLVFSNNLKKKNVLKQNKESGKEGAITSKERRIEAYQPKGHIEK